MHRIVLYLVREDRSLSSLVLLAWSDEFAIQTLLHAVPFCIKVDPCVAKKQISINVSNSGNKFLYFVLSP